MKWIVRIVLFAALLAALGAAAFRLSPWPSVLLIRHAFAEDAERRNAALEQHQRAQVSVTTDIRYGPADEMLLDVYLPAEPTEGSLPTVVWVHGGGFVAGHRSDLSGYLRILAGHGFAAVAVGYTTAPGARYPEPLRQVAAALGHLRDNSGALRIDPDRIHLAGDSAGAQIAAQLAAALSDPAYADRLGIPAANAPAIRGVVLFCGIFDPEDISMEGPFAGFLRTAVWSYLGTRDFAGDPRLGEMAVARHLTPAFPPAFVSVGNGDPLAPQSVALAEAMEEQGIATQTLFFPEDYAPALPHEYQFDLDTEAGQMALEALVAFLRRDDGSAGSAD